MLNRFKQHASRLFDPNDTILVAVSGGIDSIVLAYLFQRAGFNFGIAHCNFKLRGKDSDDDERFVKKQAGVLGVSCYTTVLKVKDTSKKDSISIQMAAREMRYDWFEKVRQENGYRFIATAHHLNDSIETILLNLIKGTGIAGLLGVPVMNERIIRPLHFTTKDEINSFAVSNDIEYREDRSNKEVKYQRNKIRQEVIPILKELNPSLEQ
ncbi:MAG: tRNA lysidine(34) synthetase TilS, partial [Bacteroidetes bacterium]|nr:tRNA lysidine(34) synthetase TilS [Bacteroidota bacterium]